MRVYLQQQDICHLICITPQLRSSPSLEVLSPFLAISSVCSFYPILLAAVLCHAVTHGSTAVWCELLLVVLGDLWRSADSCHPLSHFLVKQHRALSLI